MKITQKNMTKEGISLIVLVITIIVGLILVSVAVISTANAIDNATITTFAKDLTEIKDATEGYYISNNVMPFEDGTSEMSISDINTLVSAKSDSFKNFLTAELLSNGDETGTGTVTSKYYRVSLSKLNITKSTYGIDTTNSLDILLVSYPNLNVYYLNGVNAKNKTYFSLTDTLIKTTNIIRPDPDTSATTLTSSGGITVTRKKSWTNTMGIDLKVDMSLGEQLRVQLEGGVEKVITTSVGVNNFEYDTISGIGSTPAFDQTSEIDPFLEKTTNRLLYFKKYSGTQLIGSVKVDLANYDTVNPNIVDNSAVVSSYSSINSVNLTVFDATSGIKEVRYEYLKKYNDNADVVDYYAGVSDFDSTYMKTKGKLASVGSDFKTTISTAKNIKTIKIAVIDKAGNVMLYDQQMSTNMYLGYSLDSVLSGSIKLTSNTYSLGGVGTLTISRGYDGVNFSDTQTYNLNTSTVGVTSKQVFFYNTSASKVYFKIDANTYSGTSIQETRIFSVDVTGAVPEIWASSIDTIVDTVPIPKGFYYVGGTRNTGLVISDSPSDRNTGVSSTLNGNQFVWVPVKDGIGSNGSYAGGDTTTVQYKKWLEVGTAYTSTTEDTLPAGILSEQTQVLKYGGFYIGRFEAGNASSILVSKKSGVYNNYAYASAKTLAEAMYKYTVVKSGMITGTQWDTTMRWIQNSGYNVTTDSTTWGNYNNASFSYDYPSSNTKAINTSSLLNTGAAARNSVNNIYDLAGNLSEWTTEIYGAVRVVRGGAYNAIGTSYPAGIRDATLPTSAQTAVGFRVVLYIL